MKGSMASEADEKGGKGGQRFGRFEVLAHIASGGMGAVYKAFDTRTKDIVALKVMSPELAAKPNMLIRFRREAMSAARLQKKLEHENIVKILEFGEAHSTFYLALEFVDGKDLHEYIQRSAGGKLHPDEARDIALQAAYALDHAYRAGVVHRDVKPSNFLIAKRDGKPLVKLTDLGLARHQDDDEHRITKAGTTLGTVDYMAPEQARDSGKADIRSDMYALGCTLFHMLAGRVPFNKGSLAERIMQHIEAEPPDVCKFNEAVSKNLGLVIRKMLSKKPKDRFQTPQELIEHLENPERIVQPKQAEKKPRKPESAERTRPPSADRIRARRKDEEETSWVPFAIGGSLVLVVFIVTMVIMNLRGSGSDAKVEEKKPIEQPFIPVAETKAVDQSVGPPAPELRPLYTPVLPLDHEALTAEFYGPFKTFPAPPAGAATVVLSRAPLLSVTTATAATLQEAWAKLPEGPCVIEVRDQGPHFVGSLPKLENRQIWLRAAPGFRPLLAWDTGADRTLLSVAKGSLTLENLDVVVRGGKSDGPAQFAQITGGDFQARGCTFTFTGRFPAGIVLAQLDPAGGVAQANAGPIIAAVQSPGGGEARFRLSRCFVRGLDVALLATRRLPVDALVDGSLVVGGSPTLVQLKSSDTDLNTLRLVRSTLVAGGTLLSWQANDGQGGSPRLKTVTSDCLLANDNPSGANRNLLHLAGGASPQLAHFKVVNTAYAGWDALLKSGSTTAADLESWRLQWGHREGDVVLADAWPPRPLGDPAVLPALAYAPGHTPAAFLASTGHGPVGCDFTHLPPEPALWRPYVFEALPARLPETFSDDVPEIPSTPEGLYHGERIDLTKTDLGLHLQARLQTMTPGPRIVLHLAGKGAQTTSPIRVRGADVVIYFEPAAAGPKEKLEPLTLDLRPGDSTALIEVQGGNLEIRNGRFRFPNSRLAALPPYMIRLQGGDLHLSRCILTGPLSKTPDGFRSLVGFDGAGFAALQPSTVTLRDCAFLSGRHALELRGSAVRLRSRGCLYYALGDAVVFDLGALESSRPDAEALFEHNTVAVRQAFVNVRVSDGPRICAPVTVQTQNNYFLDPFLDEPRQASLLRADAESLGRGLIAWQGSGNYFSDRWHGFAALSEAPVKQTIADWQRLWGPFGEADYHVIEPLTTKGFAVDQPAFDRLTLPASIRIEPTPGADLSRIGLTKKR